MLWPTVTWHAFPLGFPRSTLRQSRTHGGVLFAKRDFCGAINVYEEGLSRRVERNDLNAAIIKLNLALAYLKVEMPGTALLRLEECDKALLDDKQKPKHAYRRALALYAMAKYDECLHHLCESQTLDESTPDWCSLLQQVKARLLETSAGSYDWPGIYERILEGNPSQISDYVGPTKVVNQGSKGLGVITTRPLAAGELLLVSNPLATAGQNGKLDCHTLGLNLASKSLDPCSTMDVIAAVYQKLKGQPELRVPLETLFAGQPFKRRSLAEGSYAERNDQGFVDAGRLEGIVTYNSFKPQCITTPLYSQQSVSMPEDDMKSATALYHLPSFVNHSCLGNASFIFLGSVLVVRATRALQSGEEVLFS